MIDLRRLQHLLALTDERHFARAAERVHLSQPAFSRSIQAIEAQVGMRLFEREAGAVRPTPAGEFLIERARRLMFDARCVERDVELYRDSRLGDTAFGAGPFPAATLVPAVVAELRRLHPEVGMRVEVNNWRQLLERLRAEDIEFFVADVREMPADAALEIRSLGHQLGGFYAHPGHPLAGHAHTLAEVWSYGVASVRLPEAVKTRLGALMGLPAGELPTLRLECDDMALLKSVALHGDTVLASTDAAVRADLDAGALLQLQVTNLPPIPTQMGVVGLRNRTPSPVARKVIALIESCAQALNSPRSARAAPRKRARGSRARS